MNHRFFPFIVFVLFFCPVIASCRSGNKEEVFWKWFAANEQRLYESQTDQDQVFRELSAELNKVNPDLAFELSPADENNIREFTVSADGIKEMFPVVIALVEKAPKLEHWKVSAFRQRIPGDDMQIRYDNKLTISYDDIYFRYAADGDKIGIELNIRNFKGMERMGGAIYILLDGLIGEYDMETKIGWIEMKKLDEKKIDSMYKLVELRDIVDGKTK